MPLTQQIIKTIVQEQVRTELKSVNKRIDSLDIRIDSLDKGLNKRIDSLDTSLNHRIDLLAEDTSARFENLETKIDNLTGLVVGIAGDFKRFELAIS